MAQAIKGAITARLRSLCGARLLGSFARNQQNQDLMKFASTTDFLLGNLKSAPNTRTVLEMVAQHNNIMNNKHIMQALRTLFTLQKNGNSELSTNEILAHKDFKKLCRKLRTQAPGIELGDTIEALKVVSYVGVSAESTIFQVLLQLIRHNVNQLNLQQIIFLEFLLSQAGASPLVEALKIALPMVFEIHLPVKMDYPNPAHLAEYLYFASRNNLSEDSVERIVSALLEHPEFDVKTARSIVWSVCEMQGHEMFRPLMKKAIDSLVVHLDDLSFNDMETTLTKLISRFTRKHSYFYNQTFYESCANHVIDKDLGFKQSIYILRKFGRLNFFHQYLLDYMCKKVHENPDVLAKADPVDVYSIAVATSMTDYKPPHWDTVKNIIARSENVANSDRKEIIWIKFAASLCLLDIFKLDVLNKCLNASFLQQLFSKRKFMSDFENYVTVWQSIKLFRPEFNCLLTPAYDPEALVKNFRQSLEFPLEAALHKALGGEGYVKTDLHSKSGVQIDHAVVFRKGGYPVAMNFPEDVEFIEEIEVPPDNQLVAILGLRHFSYTLNNRIARSSTNLNVKVLESQGYQVVPVNLEVWEGLPDFERIPYIMRAIKERTVGDLNVSESVI
ncbi:uncharacterized protein LOC135126209 [Zophobas morio]|uniref:uncharacterized protein LOC135126209 n=1 Tax=Zophobas morio TaxID=2755281 RepID=UPI003083BD03